MSITKSIAGARAFRMGAAIAPRLFLRYCEDVASLSMLFENCPSMIKLY